MSKNNLEIKNTQDHNPNPIKMIKIFDLLEERKDDLGYPINVPSLKPNEPLVEIFESQYDMDSYNIGGESYEIQLGTCFVDNLYVVENVQRDLDISHVKHIMKEFKNEYYSIPTGVMDYDGRIIVVDGQHRCSAKILKNSRRINIQIIKLPPNKNTDEITHFYSDAFLGANSNVKKVDKYYKLVSLANMGNPTALTLFDQCEKNDVLPVPPKVKKKYTKYFITHMKILESIITDSIDYFPIGVKIMKDLWKDHHIDAPVLNGIVRFISVCDDMDKSVDIELLKKTIKKHKTSSSKEFGEYLKNQYTNNNKISNSKTSKEREMKTIAAFYNYECNKIDIEGIL